MRWSWSAIPNNMFSLTRTCRALATHLLDYIHENICPRVAREAMVREEAAG